MTPQPQTESDASDTIAATIQELQDELSLAQLESLNTCYWVTFADEVVRLLEQGQVDYSEVIKKRKEFDALATLTGFTGWTSEARTAATQESAP